MNTLTISKPLPPIIDDVIPNDDDIPSLAEERQPAEPETEVEDSPATPFPMHCLPGIAGEMAKEIARVSTSQNETLAATAILGILSASLGAGIRASTGGERYVRPNIYLLVIADSGTGKGESSKLACAPFYACEFEAIKEFDLRVRPGLIAKLQVAEARAKKICGDAAKMAKVADREAATEEYARAEEELAQIQQKLDAAPKWVVADVTKEKLAIILRAQPGEAAASISSEARGILSIVKGKYSKEGGDEDLYCSAYSGDPLSVDRVKGRKITLNDPCLSILWMVQPDAARDAFKLDSMTVSGLFPRFLIVNPKAEPQERFTPPDPIPASIKDEWGSLIRSLAFWYRGGGDEPKTVTVAADAGEVMHEYERENVRRRRRKGDLCDIASYVARWTENAWKIALVLHCAKYATQAHTEELELTTAINAVEVMRWFSERQLEVLHEGRREKLQKRLLALLAVLAEAKGEISIRDLRRTHGFEDGELQQLVSMFPNCFKIEKRQPEKGRPSICLVKV
jgi:hypothetical protein